MVEAEAQQPAAAAETTEVEMEKGETGDSNPHSIEED